MSLCRSSTITLVKKLNLKNKGSGVGNKRIKPLPSYASMENTHQFHAFDLNQANLHNISIYKDTCPSSHSMRLYLAVVMHSSINVINNYIGKPEHKWQQTRISVLSTWFSNQQMNTHMRNTNSQTSIYILYDNLFSVPSYPNYINTRHCKATSSNSE